MRPQQLLVLLLGLLPLVPLVAHAETLDITYDCNSQRIEITVTSDTNFTYYTYYNNSLVDAGMAYYSYKHTSSLRGTYRVEAYIGSSGKFIELLYDGACRCLGGVCKGDNGGGDGGDNGDGGGDGNVTLSCDWWCSSECWLGPACDWVCSLCKTIAGLQKAISDIASWITGFADVLLEHLSMIGSAVVSILSAFGNALQNAGQMLLDAVGGFASFISAAAGAVGAVFASLVELVLSPFKAVMQAVSSFVSNSKDMLFMLGVAMVLAGAFISRLVMIAGMFVTAYAMLTSELNWSAVPYLVIVIGVALIVAAWKKEWV